jgi:hypothetical protein
MSDDVPGSQGETPPSPAARELLTELAAVRRRTRSARHAYWFPLVLFGVLTCLAAPLYISAAPRIGREGPVIGAAALGGSPAVLGGQNGGNGFYLGWYWLAALVGGFLVTLLWYRWHARSIGVQTPARGPIVTGVVLTVLALLLPLLSRLVPFLYWLWPGDLWIRGTVAFLIIAVGLCFLAWAERSVGLVVTAVVYTGAALLANLYDIENVLFRLGWNVSNGTASLTVLPNVLLPGMVLLVAGAAAFFAQRPRRQVRPA